MASLASLNGEVKAIKRPCLRRHMVFLRMTLKVVLRHNSNTHICYPYKHAHASEFKKRFYLSGGGAIPLISVLGRQSHMDHQI